MSIIITLMLKNSGFKTFSFSVYDDYAKIGVKSALERLYCASCEPIVVCVGSDLVLGDSLGPIVGTMLKGKCNDLFVYGSLNMPVTAKEIKCASENLKKMHNDLNVISVDAAVGNKDEVGQIKVFNRGLMPGLGVNKKLPILGDISIIGIVAEKTNDNYNLFKLTRLGFIYKMAEIISSGIIDFSTKFFDEKAEYLSKNNYLI